MGRDRMVTQISRDLEAHPVGTALTVTLGDYVDRGPDSRGVIERLMRNPFQTPLVALKGNHESLFQAFLVDPAVAGQWRRLGGLETLHSYGVPVSSLMIGKNYEEASEALRAALPPAHLEFLRSLWTSLPIRKYFLCHAGVRPGIALDRQSEADLYGFARSSFPAVRTSARLSCMAMLRPNRPRCGRTGSTSTPAPL
jgi:calcineurin-like phosphoesterase family protein